MQNLSYSFKLLFSWEMIVSSFPGSSLSPLKKDKEDCRNRRRAPRLQHLRYTAPSSCSGHPAASPPPSLISESRSTCGSLSPLEGEKTYTSLGSSRQTAKDLFPSSLFHVIALRCLNQKLPSLHRLVWYEAYSLGLRIPTCKYLSGG